MSSRVQESNAAAANAQFDNGRHARAEPVKHASKKLHFLLAKRSTTALR